MFSPEYGSFSSLDGRSTVRYTITAPEKPLAVVQFMHGMAEHRGRYEPIANFFAENGVAFCITDHIGHGESKFSEADRGYFGRGGWRTLVGDTAEFSKIVSERFPDAPLFEAGHSMGSFICRELAAERPELARGWIFIGTGEAGAAARAGKLITGVCAGVSGHRVSSALNELSFAGYNSRIERPRTPFDWLSVDEGNVNRYIEDPDCGFMFTNDGLYNLSSLLCRISSRRWAESVNKTAPVLLLSGSEDPVGAYGAGPRRVAERLASAGVRDVTLRLVRGDRHEVLNEADREENERYILDWIKGKI